MTPPVAGGRRSGARRRDEAGELDAVLASLPAAYFLLDGENRFTDYRGPPEFPLLAPPEAFLGRRLEEILPPPAATLLAEACERARRTPVTAQAEYPLPDPRGQRWYEARIRQRPDGALVALVHDITERKDAEIARHQSDARSRALIRLSPVSILVTRLDDGLVREVNEAFTRLTGYSRDEVLGRTTLDFGLYPSVLDRERIVQAIRADGRLVGAETMLLTKDRVPRRVLFSVERIRLDDEDCALAVALDATEMIEARAAIEEARALLEERVRERTAELVAARDQLERDMRARIEAEAEKGRLEERLRRSQALEAVGRLAGGVAHDFNNLLGSVLACAYAARVRSRDPEAVLEETDRIESLCRQGGEVTRHLLELAREPAGVVQCVDLAAEVERLRVLVERAAGRGVDVRVEVEEGPLRVRGDRGLIAAGLLNLCLNARDAMEHGGTLTIRAETRPAGNGAWVAVSITDTGPGVPPELRDRIFQPFFTTKQGGRGTGLGLSTALATAQRFGGTIEVESSPGSGSTFTLVLPAWADEAAPPESPAPEGRSAAAGAPAEGPLVLLVEDEEYLGRMVEAVLASEGYRVARVRSGVAALEAVRDRRGEIALAVLDLVLPGLGGAEVHRLLRTLAPEIPVLFATGRPDLAAAVPGAPVLGKPFTDSQLLEAVACALRTSGRAGAA